jgi:hypothetical protein
MAKFGLVRCLLHPDEKVPSGGFLVHPKDNRVKFHCFHEHKSYALVDLYARLVLGFGEDVPTGPLLPLLDTRLLIAAGAIDRPDVPHDPLPPEASEGEHQLYDAFLDLVAAKWVRFPGEATTFSYKFAEKWAGMPWEKVANIWKRLLAREVVKPVDKWKAPEGNRETKLYLPTQAWLIQQLGTVNVNNLEVNREKAPET